MFDHVGQRPLHEYAAYFGDFRGAIRIYAEGLVLHTRAGEVSIRNGYVDAITKTGDIVLGKMPVELSYYDMFGNKQRVAAQMRETDFLALKKDLNR